jgi:hypothetical protein
LSTASSDKALAVRERAPIQMGTRGVELRTMEDLYRFAQAVAMTPFAPKDFKTPEAIMIACQYGLELGLTPMQSLQSVAVINGKPSLYGDGLLGVVLASGLVDDFSEVLEGEGDERRAVCRVKRRGVSTVCERTFSVKDAKAAGLWGKGGPWSSYPNRMLGMRARSWALRDLFSDVTRGMIAVEEALDIPVKNVAPLSEAPPPAHFPVTPKTLTLVRSRAKNAKLDPEALSLERYGQELADLSQPDALDLLDHILTREPGGTPTGAELLDRIKENAPEVGAVMEAHMPARHEPDVLDAEEEPPPAEVLDALGEAIARDDEREEDEERAAIQDADERLTKDELSTLRAMWQASKLNATSDLAAFAAAFAAKPDAIPRRHLEDALSWISEHKRRK